MKEYKSLRVEKTVKRDASIPSKILLILCKIKSIWLATGLATCPEDSNGPGVSLPENVLANRGTGIE